MSKKHRVCPAEMAGMLDNVIRRWFQDPRKILSPYVAQGMTVLDIGCGPGFFSIDLAKMVGETGRVIASDLQEGMLQRLRSKISGTDLEQRITLHRSEEHKIGLSGNVDFVLAFYVVHEVPDQEHLLKEIASLLKPSGQLFIAEPSFHVSNKAFEETVEIARAAGLDLVERPRVFLSKAVVMEKIRQ